MRYFKRLQLLMTLMCMVVLMSTTAQAALKAVGPVDAITTIPTYYQDTTSLPLQPCLDQNGMCLLPPPFDALTVPTSPITATGPISNANFPGEGFYYSAQAIMPIEGGELANLAYVLEYAFLAGVSPNTAIVFLRTDLQKMINLTPNSTYRVTHPYGTFDFTTDNQGNARGGGGVVLRQEDPAGGAGAAVNYFTPDMKAATNTNIGPFLKPADGILLTRLVGAETHTYIGDAATAVPVTGGTNGNVFTIDRIVTGGAPVSPQTHWSTNLFVLMGRVFTGTAASPMTIDRATYARDASTGQVDIFVTAETAATLTLSGTGIAATPLAQDLPNTGLFFVHVPFTTVLPSALSITNSLDFPAPVPHPFTLVDEVKIATADFNPTTRDLTIKADSRDNRAPLPVLSAPQFSAPNTLDASGTLVKAIPPTTIPPKTVTVTSSRGGSSTIPISVVSQVPPPVAVNDSASTSKGAAVSIDVIMNDTTAGIIDPASLVIVASPASGATVVPVSNGSILYTPTPTFIGTETFAYTVKDTLGQVSNVATVTVLVNTPPVAGNDTATSVINSTVNINVVGNDTASGSVINATTVNIVSPATCGSIAVLGNGTVNFTAPATVPAAPGTCSFSYVVSDTFVPPAISNVATVTVTIALPAPPVANNDNATTTTSTTAVINVIANDTVPASSTINPASVVVSVPTGGTAVAIANGTVNYTAPAIPGTYTFTYTVKDNFGQTSNAATVTVTVHAPPVAGNDTASAAINGTVNINVIANDVASSSLINATTVSIVSAATCGTAVALTNGTVNFTAPATVPAAPGTCSFSYTVGDTFVPSAVSNVATVTVTITPPAPPAALNDTATTTSSSTVVINVIANDSSTSSTINPASIVVTAPSGGTAVANVNGTVSYTAPAIPGTYTFTYTVKDIAVPPATSNVATVTVTVNAPFVFPSAVNDSAVVPANSSIVIPVAANDVAGTNPITPLTVSSVTVVTAPVHGTATANAGGPGTITYTPTAGFSGNDSFTYNIKDSQGFVSVTNATVAVSVTTPAPTETITVTRAQFTLANASWRLDGSTNAPIAGQTMKIFNSATVPADGATGLLATVTVAGGGSFTWSSPTGSPAPNALRRISILSSKNPNNNKAEQVTVTVR